MWHVILPNTNVLIFVGPVHHTLSVRGPVHKRALVDGAISESADAKTMHVSMLVSSPVCASCLVQESSVAMKLSSHKLTLVHLTA